MAYALRPGYEEVHALADLPVDLGDGIVSLREALQRFDSAPLEARVPVLAVGSNAYPRQLADKFGQDPVDDDTIVVVGCTVRDAAIAYCAGFSMRKGYVPVSLTHEPGARTHTWVQWLTTPQLESISRSEGPRYSLVECGRLASGESAVELHGVLRGPARVYGWVYDTLLRWPGEPEPVRFSGNPEEGFRGDARGHPQAVVLQDAVERLLASQRETLTWDGCRLPQSRRGALRELLATYGQDPSIAAHWGTFDREARGFTEGLIGSTEGPDDGV